MKIKQETNNNLETRLVKMCEKIDKKNKGKTNEESIETIFSYLEVFSRHKELIYPDNSDRFHLWEWNWNYSKKGKSKNIKFKFSRRNTHISNRLKTGDIT